MLELIESGDHSGAVDDLVGINSSCGGTAVEVDVYGDLVVSISKRDGILASGITIGILNINFVSTSTNIESQGHRDSTRNVCLGIHKVGNGTLELRVSGNDLSTVKVTCGINVIIHHQLHSIGTSGEFKHTWHGQVESITSLVFGSLNRPVKCGEPTGKPGQCLIVVGTILPNQIRKSSKDSRHLSCRNHGRPQGEKNYGNHS